MTLDCWESNEGFHICRYYFESFIASLGCGCLSSFFNTGDASLGTNVSPSNKNYLTVCGSN